MAGGEGPELRAFAFVLVSLAGRPGGQDKGARMKPWLAVIIDRVPPPHCPHTRVQLSQCPLRGPLDAAEAHSGREEGRGGHRRRGWGDGVPS